MNTEDEAEEQSEERYHIRIPASLVTCKRDYIAGPMMQEGWMRLWVRDLVVREMDAGVLCRWRGWRGLIGRWRGSLRGRVYV